ncbi:hypothetical protein EVAR_9022_1 [Eumeta japonica]|uniref:Uncharacterized protein n=1 Tax=Eumeta variegata TaxID=151549 RepID=A0A4C1TW04_EUMVA|nr:hypothetical protein EVAR_9022_1 [Eumeta japonica]
MHSNPGATHLMHHPPLNTNTPLHPPTITCPESATVSRPRCPSGRLQLAEASTSRTQMEVATRVSPNPVGTILMVRREVISHCPMWVVRRDVPSYLRPLVSLMTRTDYGTTRLMPSPAPPTRLQELYPMARRATRMSVRAMAVCTHTTVHVAVCPHMLREETTNSDFTGLFFSQAPEESQLFSNYEICI